MKEKEIRVVVKAPEGEPEVRTVKNELETFQSLCGGWIECVQAPGIDGVDYVCDEEGKLDGKDANFYLPEYNDLLVGTIVAVGFNDEGDFASLTDEQIERVTSYMKANIALGVVEDMDKYIRAEFYTFENEDDLFNALFGGNEKDDEAEM